MSNRQYRGLTRNVIKIQQGYGSFEPVVAYTLWRRHDEEDLEHKLRKDTNRLINAYIDMDKGATFLITREWKDYRHSATIQPEEKHGK